MEFGAVDAVAGGLRRVIQRFHVTVLTGTSRHPQITTPCIVDNRKTLGRRTNTDLTKILGVGEIMDSDVGSPGYIPPLQDSIPSGVLPLFSCMLGLVQTTGDLCVNDNLPLF